MIYLQKHIPHNPRVRISDSLRVTHWNGTSSSRPTRVRRLGPFPTRGERPFTATKQRAIPHSIPLGHKSAMTWRHARWSRGILRGPALLILPVRVGSPFVAPMLTALVGSGCCSLLLSAVLSRADHETWAPCWPLPTRLSSFVTSGAQDASGGVMGRCARSERTGAVGGYNSPRPVRHCASWGRWKPSRGTGRRALIRATA